MTTESSTTASQNVPGAADAAAATPAPAATDAAVTPTAASSPSDAQAQPPSETAPPEAKPADTLLAVSPEAPPPEAATDKPAAEQPKDPVKDVAKPEGDKPEGDAPKKEEGSQSAEPAPLPTYEAFTLPDDVKVDEAKLGEFTKILGQLELDTKADHAKVQAIGQDLVNRHVEGVKETVTRVLEAQTSEWDAVKASWKDTIEKDPEIGGNRAETTRANIQRFMQHFGGPAEERTAFNDYMNASGLGNYPPLVRMISKAGALLAEGKPLAGQPATTGARGPKSAQQRINMMYGGS